MDKFTAGTKDIFCYVFITYHTDFTSRIAAEVSTASFSSSSVIVNGEVHSMTLENSPVDHYRPRSSK